MQYWFKRLGERFQAILTAESIMNSNIVDICLRMQNADYMSKQSLMQTQRDIRSVWATVPNI